MSVPPSTVPGVADVTTTVAVDTAGSLPVTVSPSSLATFRSCGLKFYFAYVAGWRTPPNEHTVVGNITHAALEQLYRQEPSSRTRAAASAHLAIALAAERQRSDVAALLAQDPDLDETLEQRCEHMLDGLFALEDPASVRVRAEDCEAWTEATLYGASVRGRIDRMTGAGGGVWRVSDYKTGKPAKPAFIESALFGLFTYAATLAAAHPDRRLPDEVELLYLRERVRVNRPIVRDYLIKHAKTIGYTWRDIRRDHANQAWEARTGPVCKVCTVASGCPAKARGEIPSVGAPDHDDLLVQAGLTRRTAMPATEAAS
jgi:RecB family exonuclease